VTIIKKSIKKMFIHKGLLIGGFLAFFFLNTLNSAYSNFLPLIKEELLLSYMYSGALMSSYFVGYTIGQIPWGYLADRIGCKKTIPLSVIGVASFTIMFGLSTNAYQAIIFRFLAGLLGAGIFVPGVKLVSSWFSSVERGTALGFFSVGGSIGLIIASLTGPPLATQIGWRGSIVFFGLLGLLFSIVIWSTLQDRISLNISDKKETNNQSIFKSRNFWILALTQFLRLGSNYAFIAWLPILLYEEFGLNILLTSVTLSMFNLAGMISNPVGGFISDRVGEKRVLLISFFILFLGLILFMTGKSFSKIFIAVFILGWFINFIRSPSFTMIPKLYGVNLASKISGVHNTFASMGALVIPFLLGYIRDATLSYNAGWTTLSVLLFFGSIINFFLE